MKKLSIAVVVFIGLIAGVAYADSITVNPPFALNGSIGGSGGRHTIVVDGV